MNQNLIVNTSCRHFNGIKNTC